ncbi:MAG: hypothetical protein KF835_02010 [Xanthobacteraceae bacterium]|nr:hypothetical protein [Xanthobacteraceae bacterium]
MIIGILQHTPYWVWGIFVLLLVLGLTQTRARNVSRALVYVLPAIMIPLSFFTIASTFGIKPLPVIAWLAGVAAAFLFNIYIFRAPSGVRYDAATRKFAVPGSWVPLVLMMTIFLSRFVLGVTRAINPALIGNDVFVGIVSAVLGLCSGLFAARAVKTLSAQR